MGARISLEMKQAIKAVKLGMPVIKAATKYGVAKTSIYRSKLYLEWINTHK